MSIVVGPKVSNTGVIFYVDGFNVKSFPGTGIIRNLVSSEEQPSTATVTNGEFNMNFGVTGDFISAPLTSLTTITACTVVANTPLAHGTSFSICSSTQSSNKATTQGSPDAHTILTTTALGASTYVDNATSVQGSPDAHTILTTSSTGSVAYVDNATSVQGSPDAHTILTTTALGTSTYVDNATSVQGSPDAHTILTTTVMTIDDTGFYPDLELSMGFDTSGIIVRNKVGDKDVTITRAVSPSVTDVYTAVFRTQPNTKPLTIYQNGEVLIESPVLTSSAQFIDSSVFLFSRGGLSSHAQYGVRSVMVYNREATQVEIQQLHNLLRG